MPLQATVPAPGTWQRSSQKDILRICPRFGLTGGFDTGTRVAGNALESPANRAQGRQMIETVKLSIAILRLEEKGRHWTADVYRRWVI